MKRLKYGEEHEQHEASGSLQHTYTIDDCLPDSMFASPNATVDVFRGETTTPTTQTSNNRLHTQSRRDNEIRTSMTNSLTNEQLHTQLAQNNDVRTSVTNSLANDRLHTQSQQQQSNERTGMTNSPTTIQLHTQLEHQEHNDEQSQDKNNNNTLSSSMDVEHPISTRRSSRVTAKPYRLDPAAYVSSIMDNPQHINKQSHHQTVTNGSQL